MRSFFLTLILLGSAASGQCFAQSDPFKSLENGMLSHSDSSMNRFFELWFQSSEANRARPTSKLQKKAEELVETMWNPANYHTLLWGWTVDSIAPRELPPYLVFWPTVPIYSGSTSQPPVDSLKNMFPSTLYGSKLLLYNLRFIDSIQKFLIWRNPNRKADQSYISKFVSLSCHMGGCGVLGEPAISSIRFNNTGDTAIVSFGMAEQGIEETFSEVNGKWKAIKRDMKWIE